ncbi:MAG: hypothetical protein ACOCY3_02560, partial [Desulfosalsimonas sp.]
TADLLITSELLCLLSYVGETKRNKLNKYHRKPAAVKPFLADYSRLMPGTNPETGYKYEKI